MDCRAALTSARKQLSPQLAPPPPQQSKHSKGTKRGADKEAEDERDTTSHKQIDQRFKSAKHEPAAVQTAVAQKQSHTQTQPQPQPQINGAVTASTESKASGVSSSRSLPSSSSSSSHSVPCPPGFNAALWAQLTSRPSPVAIPANSIKLTYLHGLLSASECCDLVSGADAAGFAHSQTNAGVTSDRTSHTSHQSGCDPSRRALGQRIQNLCGGERVLSTSVIRYQPGQQYTPHYDSYFNSPPLRQYTIFAYLNDVEGGGGETEFTKLGVKFKPSRGDALFWENHATRSSPHHAESKHAGRPPLSGVKYAQPHDREALGQTDSDRDTDFSDDADTSQNKREKAEEQESDDDSDSDGSEEE